MSSDTVQATAQYAAVEATAEETSLPDDPVQEIPEETQVEAVVVPEVLPDESSTVDSQENPDGNAAEQQVDTIAGDVQVAAEEEPQNEPQVRILERATASSY